MATKVIAGKTVNVNEEGYLLDPKEWTIDIAHEIAKEEGITLTQKHIDVINFIRDKVLNGETLSMRCLLYTSDAADDLLCVDLGGRRIIKKKKPKLPYTPHHSTLQTIVNTDILLHQQ